MVAKYCEKKSISSFTGPIFLIGMPRSGTKLLREILNNHSLIGIPGFESHFICDFQNRIHNYGNLAHFQSFKHFYYEISKLNFFKKLATVEHFSLDAKRWHGMLENGSFSDVIETFYTTYTHHKGKSIWGDKTPFYLLQLPKLKRLFPHARFIHIIRDARDQCLSAKNAWNKNYFRSAQRWYDNINKCRQDAKKIPEQDYMEVKYEQMIRKPVETIESVCSFLWVQFEREMVRLNKPTENLGNARGQADIMRNNFGKWRYVLSEKQVYKIEKICGPLLSDLGYPVNYCGSAERLGIAEMTIFKMMDSAHQIRFDIGNLGLFPGIGHVLRKLSYTKYY